MALMINTHRQAPAQRWALPVPAGESGAHTYVEIIVLEHSLPAVFSLQSALPHLSSCSACSVYTKNTEEIRGTSVNSCPTLYSLSVHPCPLVILEVGQDGGWGRSLGHLFHRHTHVTSC
jgi:hypothetical protein